MNSYALDTETHDMYVKNGQIARVTRSDAVMQVIKTRLLLVQEEWFMDLSAGLPWFTQMLSRPIDLYKIRNYISREIQRTEGVDTLISVDLRYNSEDRKLDIEFRYTDVYGRTVEGAV